MKSWKLDKEVKKLISHESHRDRGGEEKIITTKCKIAVHACNLDHLKGILRVYRIKIT